MAPHTRKWCGVSSLSGSTPMPARKASTGLSPRVAARSLGTSPKARTREAARPAATAASSPPPWSMAA